MWAKLRSFADALLRRRRFERGMRDEISFHLDAYAEDLQRTGLSRQEALRRARIEFGTVDAVQQDCRQARGVRLIDELSVDLRYALRLMLKTRGVTVAAVLSLAVGIGANTALFSLIDSVMLRTVPVDNPHELVFVAHGRGDQISTSSNYPLYERYQAAEVFSGLASYNTLVTKVDTPAGLELVQAQLTTAGYHHVLGVRFVLGRGFIPRPHDQSETTREAVISDRYWARRFARDPQVIGARLTVHGEVVTIVGVTAPGFDGLVPGTGVDITLPLALERAEFFSAHDTWRGMPIVGRLKPGVDIPRARAAVDAVFQQYMSEPENAGIRTRAPESFAVADLVPAAHGSNALRRRYSTSLLVLFALVALVLLVSSTNIANLLLARSAARAREVAIRSCAGGTRGRLVRQFLTESLLLAICGGGLGVLIAMWGSQFVLNLLNATEVPVVLDVALNPRVLGFTLAVSIATGLMFGLLPALKATRLDLAPALKTDNLQATSAPAGLLRPALLVVQLAMCAAVVVVASVLAETLVNLRGLDGGFDGDSVMLFAIADVPADRQQVIAAQLAADVLRLPGVVAAASAASTPVHSDGNQRRLRIPGVEDGPEPPGAWTNVITPGFFDTFGVAIVRGRGFDRYDAAAGKKVAVVNQTLARSYYPDVDPIGRTLFLGADSTEPVEIVGVARDVYQQTLREAPPRMIYTPFDQSDEPPSRFTLAIRTAGPARAMAATVRGAIEQVDSQIVVGYVRTMEQQVEGSLVRERLLATLSSTFALVTLALAVIGVYGVMSYEVTRRSREIGIRIALGAKRRAVVAGALREAVLVGAAGVAAGAVAAAASTTVLAPFSFGVAADDPARLIAISALLFVTVCLAALLPARRAATLDPMTTLRTD
jgi:predicted permease